MAKLSFFAVKKYRRLLVGAVVGWRPLVSGAQAWKYPLCASLCRVQGVPTNASAYRHKPCSKYVVHIHQAKPVVRFLCSGLC